MLLQHFHQLFKALRRVVAKHGAELLHEPVKVRFASLHLVPHHLVQLAHHLLHGRHLFRRHVLELLLHLLAHVLGHLLFQHVQQFLEHLLGIRVHEVVLHQLLDLAAEAVGQIVQLFPVSVGPLFQHVQQPFLHGAVFVGCLVYLFLRFRQSPVNAFPFCLENFFQPFLQVIHHRVHVVLLKLLAAPVPQHVHQLAEAGHLLAVAVLHTVPEQFAQGLHNIALFEKFVRQAVHQLVGVYVKQFLGAVPLGVAVSAVKQHFGLHCRRMPLAGDVRDNGRLDNNPGPGCLPGWSAGWSASIAQAGRAPD